MAFITWGTWGYNEINSYFRGVLLLGPHENLWLSVAHLVG